MKPFHGYHGLHGYHELVVTEKNMRELTAEERKLLSDKKYYSQHKNFIKLIPKI